VIDKLGLKNIELRAASIADVDESWGQYDFVICHGVFSWVPPAIQDRILWICRHLLAPSGVAYVSYNTNPGWRLKGIVRDLMRFHADRFDEPQTKVQQARSILNFMARASAGFDHPLSRVLARQAESLAKDADYYLYHEHLEELNQPFYFREFVEKARQAGLDYLGEAWHHTVIDDLPEEVQEGLQAISSDIIDLEQFVDFLGSRTFRRTLLVHEGTRIVRTPEPAVMEPLYVSALARPESLGTDVTSVEAEKFTLDDGHSAATTNVPILKAALHELFDRWPLAVPFRDLLSAVFERLQTPAAQQPTFGAVLASFMVQGYITHMVALHSEPFRFTLEVSQRPRASELARFVAPNQAMVPTLRHRLALLTPVERIVLLLADGTRTKQQIAEELDRSSTQALVAGFEAATLPPENRLAVVSESLERLSRNSLLEA
jgi:methyltransferase-like protein